MSAEILKLTGVAFCLAPPIAGLLVALCNDLHLPSFVGRRPSQSEQLIYLTNGLTYSHLILPGHLCRPSIQLHRICHHQVLPVGVYRSSKDGRKCSAPNGFESNFCDAAFCLPYQLYGFLFQNSAKEEQVLLTGVSIP